MHKLSMTQRYGLFGIWTGLHILAAFFSSFLTGALAVADLVTLFFVLPLSPSILPEIHIGHTETEDTSEEQTLSLLEYLREIESGFHQRLDGLEGMLEENTLLTKIRRRGKGSLTLVPQGDDEDQDHEPTTEPDPAQHV